MSQLPGNSEPDPATKDDLHKLEARMDARFQAVNSRFSTVDRRHDNLRVRVDSMENQWHVFGERVDSRMNAVEQRFDETDHRIDVAFGNVAVQVAGSRRDTRRYMFALGATNAVLCLTALTLAT
jgi:hypothetical protein